MYYSVFLFINLLLPHEHVNNNFLFINSYVYCCEMSMKTSQVLYSIHLHYIINCYTLSSLPLDLNKVLLVHSLCFIPYIHEMTTLF